MDEELTNGFFEGMPWETDNYEIDPTDICGIQPSDGDVHIDPAYQ